MLNIISMVAHFVEKKHHLMFLLNPFDAQSSVFATKTGAKNALVNFTFFLLFFLSDQQMNTQIAAKCLL